MNGPTPEPHRNPERDTRVSATPLAAQSLPHSHRGKQGEATLRGILHFLQKFEDGQLTRECLERFSRRLRECPTSQHASLTFQIINRIKQAVQELASPRPARATYVEALYRAVGALCETNMAERVEGTYEDQVVLARASGHQRLACYSLVASAVIADMRDEPEIALACFEDAQRLILKLNLERSLAALPVYHYFLAQTLQTLDEKEFLTRSREALEHYASKIVGIACSDDARRASGKSSELLFNALSSAAWAFSLLEASGNREQTTSFVAFGLLLDSAAALKDPLVYAKALVHFGRYLRQLHDYPQAIAVFGMAANTVAESNSREAQSLFTLAKQELLRSSAAADGITPE